MRGNSGFNLFYQTISKNVEGIDGSNNPALSPKWCRPNYFILQFVSGFGEMSDIAGQCYPCAVKEHLKVVYFETIDAAL